jgi:acetoin utilization deacetylase AcuC-like enzyme/ankyrin repeat protein
MADEALFSMVMGNCSGQELEGFLGQFPLDQDSMQFLVNRRDSDRYTVLHRAVFARNMEAVKVLTTHGADVNIKCHGTPLLHIALCTAVLPGSREFGLGLFRLLLEKEADVLAKDDTLGNIMHTVAELGLVEALEMLTQLSTGYEIDCKDRAGQRPLHRAAHRDNGEIANKLLEMGAMPSAQTSYGSTPLHVAAACASTAVWACLVKNGASTSTRDCWGRTALELAELNGWGVDAGDESLLCPTPRLTEQNTMKYPTVVVTHPYCRQHYTCPPSERGQEVPPENTRRLHVIIDEKEGCLKSSDLVPKLRWMPDCRKAAMSDVLRVHEWAYIRKIQGHCEQIAHDPEAYNGISNLDGDTTLSRLTFEAALRGAGGVCEAVDQVMNGQARNAFVPVRPPGHHAGPRGLTKGEEGGPDSHGFCFLNNISIGSAYAMNKYREKIRRVAIIDFDVHHGNGTEETVKWLRPGLDTEEYYNNSTFGAQYVPRYKPWYGEEDADNVLFVSIHGFGPRERGLEHLLPAGAFYPGSGATNYPKTIPPKVGDLASKSGGSSRGNGKGLVLSSMSRSRSVGSFADSEAADSSGDYAAAAGTGADATATSDDVKKEQQEDDDEEEDEDEDDDFGMGMAVDETFDSPEHGARSSGGNNRNKRSGDDAHFSSPRMRGMRQLYVFCSMFFLHFLVCVSLSSLYIYRNRSISTCLHSLTPRGTSLTIISPSIDTILA